MAQPVASQVTLHQPRTPAVFRGDAFEDVEDWLEQFERVASFNQWDPQQKLRQVYYSLDDGARTWYENREARGELSTWDEFRQELLESFACTDRREHAQRLLESRIQKPNETVAMFAEDMARLFRRADPEMSEPKKLRHLMHGVKEQLFSGLVRNPPRTVKGFIKEATAIERALQERCRQYDRGAGRSSSTTGTGDCCVHRSISAGARPIYRSGGVAAARTRSVRTGVCISRRHRAPRNQAGLNDCGPGTAATAPPSKLCVGGASPTASCGRLSAKP